MNTIYFFIAEIDTEGRNCKLDIERDVDDEY